MELLVVMVIAAFVGLTLRYVLRGREHYGILIAPAAAASAAGIAWGLMTLIGLGDGGWIWAVSLLASVVGGTVVPMVLRRTRPQRDAATLASQLSRS